MTEQFPWHFFRDPAEVVRPHDLPHVAPVVPLAEVMAHVVRNAEVDPADEAGVILALMNVGYRCSEILEHIEDVKHRAWVMMFMGEAAPC